MREFKAWGEAVEYLLSNPEETVLCFGNTHTYKHALFSIGYGGAKRRGVLDDYKRLILDL